MNDDTAAVSADRQLIIWNKRRTEAAANVSGETWAFVREFSQVRFSPHVKGQRIISIFPLKLRLFCYKSCILC
jgi:hypothetical protein